MLIQNSKFRQEESWKVFISENETHCKCTRDNKVSHIAQDISTILQTYSEHFVVETIFLLGSGRILYNIFIWPFWSTA